MSPFKIVGWIGLAIAIVGAFVNVPYGATVLVVLGLLGGLWINDEHVRVIVSALALSALSGVLNNIPTIGSYLANIVGSFGLLVAGSAIMIVMRNAYARFKP
jgi:hypothetical protein